MANRKDRTRSTKSIKSSAPYQLRREDNPEPVLVSDPVPVPVPVPDPVLASLDLFHLPTPDEIALDLAAPDDAFAPPGLVPAGDSRSLRRGAEFALVYRHHTHVISRTGHLGTHGCWRITSYPTPSAASHAYALHAAHLVDDGFADYHVTDG